MAKWIRDDRWPFGQTGPWDVEKVRAWAAKTLAADPAAGGEAKPRGDAAELSLPRKLDMALKNVKREAAQFDLDVKKGHYHRVDECEQRLARQVQEVKTRLLNMCETLPFDADGRAIVKGRLLEVLQVLSGG